MTTPLSTDDVLARLAERGLELPAPSEPAGSYAPVVVRGLQGSVAAQFPMVGGEPAFTGRVGAERSEEEGRRAAELAALAVLAQVRARLGGFERLDGLLHVAGHHTRSAFAPSHLPWDLTVELVVTFALRAAEP